MGREVEAVVHLEGVVLRRIDVGAAEDDRDVGVDHLDVEALAPQQRRYVEHAERPQAVLRLVSGEERRIAEGELLRGRLQREAHSTTTPSASISTG